MRCSTPPGRALTFEDMPGPYVPAAPASRFRLAALRVEFAVGEREERADHVRVGLSGKDLPGQPLGVAPPGGAG